LVVDVGVGVDIAVGPVVLVGDCEGKVTTGGIASTEARYWSMGMMALWEEWSRSRRQAIMKRAMLIMGFE
jgi:hypothetical protein